MLCLCFCNMYPESKLVGRFGVVKLSDAFMESAFACCVSSLLAQPDNIV